MKAKDLLDRFDVKLEIKEIPHLIKSLQYELVESEYIYKPKKDVPTDKMRFETHLIFPNGNSMRTHTDRLKDEVSDYLDTIENYREWQLNRNLDTFLYDILETSFIKNLL